jgi:hypothetical protein
MIPITRDDIQARGYTKIRDIAYGSLGAVMLCIDQKGKQFAIKKIAQPN